MSAEILNLPENALKKLFYSGIDHITMDCTGLHPISVFNFLLTEICAASYFSSTTSSTCIVCLAGSQIASTCFKEVVPSTACSNRKDYNSSSLIWSSTGHNFIIIFLTLKKVLRDSGVTALITNRIPMGNIPDPRSSLNSSPPNTFLLTDLASVHVSFSHSCPAHQDYLLLALLKSPLLSYQVSHFLSSFILLILQAWASSPFSFICLHSP